MVHGTIKVAQKLVPEQLIVHNVPLTTGIVEGRVVASAGEIKPLGMTEFISDKGQVTLTSETVGHQADHLVQSQTSVNDWRQLCQGAHVCVHLLVHKPESNRLVTNQSLVMRLAVSNRGFLRRRMNTLSINRSNSEDPLHCRIICRRSIYHVSPVGESKDDVANIPLIVRLLLEQLDPHVRDSHRQAVVKTNTSI